MMFMQGTCPAVWRSVLSLALLCTMGHPAAAQPKAPRDAARDLFEQGRAAVEARDCARAVPLFRRSQATYAARGTLFNLAQCEVEVGLVASAWRHFKELLVQLEPGDARLPITQQRIEELEPRVPSLTIKLAEGALPPLEILIDQAPYPKESIGSELPVDPGTHSVVARWADGRRVDERVLLAEGEQKAVRVAPPPAAKAPAGANAPRARAGGPVAENPPVLSPHKRSLVPAIALGAASVVGLGVGVGLTVAGSNALDDVHAQGRAIRDAGGQCSKPPEAFTDDCAELRSIGERVDTLGSAAGVAFVASGVLAAAAVTYALWPRRENETARRTRVVVAAQPTGAGVVVLGSW